MLYPYGATIYMACRSEQRERDAMSRLTSVSPAPSTPAVLKYLHFDLNDLTTIKTSAAEFARQEGKLDILWNNAGIGAATKGTTTKQALEGHIRVNCVAPLLFTEESMLHLKAAVQPGSTPRVIWTSSLMAQNNSPEGGVDYKLIESGATCDPHTDYGTSKLGNYWLATEMAKRYGGDGIISVAHNPGNLLTNMYSGQPKWLLTVLKYILHDVKYGAYTMLYSGFAPDVMLEKNGAYIWPFGVVKEIGREDLVQGANNGAAAKFWAWCESKYKPYL